MKYALAVEWHETARPNLPSLVGPFDTPEEAAAWYALNVPNGTGEVHPLAPPYATPGAAT